MKLDDENWHVLTVSRRDPETGEYTMEKAPCYHLVGETRSSRYGRGRSVCRRRGVRVSQSIDEHY